MSEQSLDERLTAVAPPALKDRVARVAGGLRAAGIHSGDSVAWQSANRDEVNVLYRACWRLGAVAAPLHHQVGAADVERMVGAVQPTLFLDDLDALPEGDPVADIWTDAHKLAVVLFTSGSSGAPKGVLHTQATLVFKAVQMQHEHALSTGDCVLMPAPAAHISGLLNGITLPGVVPFRTVFMARWDPAHALDLIEREHVTFMVGPPTFFLSMMQAPNFSSARVESLRLISSGGAGVSGAFVEEASRTFGAQVKRTYGSTEAPTIITDGHPIGPVELKLGDDDELLVRGAELFVGYLDAEQTREAFTTDGWFRTGDLATIEDGIVDIVGRKKDVIIRGGENISVVEVEEALEAHPDVRQAVAIGEPDALLGERVCAFVVTTGAAFDLDACRTWFAERGIARFKTPERVIAIDVIPLLATGKPDRAALRAAAGVI